MMFSNELISFEMYSDTHNRVLDYATFSTNRMRECYMRLHELEIEINDSGQKSVNNDYFIPVYPCLCTKSSHAVHAHIIKYKLW